MKVYIHVIVLIALLSLPHTSQATLEEGMEALWRFDEGSGTTVHDASGNGRHGTILGDLTWVDGVFKGALQFNGTQNERVEVEEYEGVVGRSDRSTLAWIKTTGAGTIVSWGPLDARWILDIYTADQGVRGALRVSVVGGFVVGSTDVRDGEWHHVASVLKSGGAPTMFDVSMYLDGEQEAVSYLARGVVNTGSSSVWIGDYDSEFWTPFTGALDEVAIFSRALSESEIRKAMDGLGPKDQAYKPYPADNDPDVPLNAQLSWLASDFAGTHNVYFGTVLADVEAASVANPLGVLVSEGQTTNVFTPGLLTYGQTYYWRVDEVNAPPTSHIVYKGEVWRFTAEPQAYPIAGENIITSASSNGPGLSPANTINGSGLDDKGRHSSEGADMWLSGSEAGGAWIQYEFDRAYTLLEMRVWNHNTGFERVIGTGIKEASITYSLDGIAWTALGSTHEFARAPGTPGYASNTTIDLGSILAQYVRIRAYNNWGGILPQYGLSEVHFMTIPVKARDPQPASGTVDVAPDITLSWRAGREAAAHEVYLGTDPNALVWVDSVTQTNYTPAALTLGQQYYWRIDEVNEAVTPSTRTGEPWSFSILEYFVVEDFESYKNEEFKEIWATWVDGYGDNSNGSIVGTGENGSAPETNIVYEGYQAMPLFYDNSSAMISEATRTFAAAQDWTLGLPSTLTLYVHGDFSNSGGGQLYVKINNAKVPFDGDPAILWRSFWTPWNVALDGVDTDLSRVTSLTIGIEGAAAQGILYVDIIRLYGQAPAILAAQDPGIDNLVASYTFENNTQDGSGHGHHGSIMGPLDYTAGLMGRALKFDGLDGLVDLGTLDVVGGGITLSLWLNPEGFAHNDARLLSKASGVGETDHWWMLSTQGLDRLLRFRLKTNDGAGTTTLLADSGGVSIDEWVHTAATWDGSTMRIYRNLDVVGSTAKGGTAVAVDASIPAAIGNQPPEAGAKPWQGLIDEVRIYNRGLSETELLFIGSGQ